MAIRQAEVSKIQCSHTKYCKDCDRYFCVNCGCACFGDKEEVRRGRFIPCRGCPTVECTCFTDLESDLLEKITPMKES